ncbi:MAG: tRNA (guanine(10)-N(2))-dimethyltransferase [Thermoplasmatota archaeon]
MNFEDIDLERIKEGKTEIFAPKHEKGAGPKSSDQKVFYNPSMELNRDISISFLKAFDQKDMEILDGMSASGIRGLRIANECKYTNVVLNDVSNDAVNLIKKNADHLNLDVKVTNDSVEKHLLENRYEYDYIDLDPFGSPVYFFPFAAKYVRDKGVIAVTATDTAVLCGTYPKVCRRKYSARPKNNWCRHENGLRILMGYCAREIARYDRGITPLLSYYDGHYFRTYLKITNGAKRANTSLNKLETYKFHDYDWEKGDDVGPLWSGRLFDEKIIKNMETLGELDEKLLTYWKEEFGFPPFFYDTNTISKFLKTAPPKMSDILRMIEDRDYKGSGTHFSPTGIKTDAPSEVILDIFKEYDRQN